ncbi:MAG: dTDP-glucose 4,6-dehydratase [Proteobacteria bacterium]|nr:dTDP-glucose 4,6-dehydratase [Pseudomonadota bacterium]
MKILVTGGAGFIGSNFVRWLFEKDGSSYKVEKVIVLDSLTYAGNLANLSSLEKFPFKFIKGDIRDAALVGKILKDEKISHLVNFAAESHVDRSILDPLAFVKTNVEGTQVLLNCAMDAGIEKYLQISTDEVYGSLGPVGRFTETTPLDPSSTYSASKAAADLLVLAANKTHQMPTVLTRCSNNYGPYQFPEKLIPLFITNALADKNLPLYGDGKNIRSWLHVDDHSRGIMAVLTKGRLGEVYNIGGAPESEIENLDVTKVILKALNKPESLIKRVEDRKGHDRRYAVDYSKIQQELGWEPQVKFEDGIKDTIKWYIENEKWWQEIKSGEYQSFYDLYYGEKLKVVTK